MVKIRRLHIINPVQEHFENDTEMSLKSYETYKFSGD